MANTASRRKTSFLSRHVLVATYPLQERVDRNRICTRSARVVVMVERQDDTEPRPVLKTGRRLPASPTARKISAAWKRRIGPPPSGDGTHEPVPRQSAHVNNDGQDRDSTARCLQIWPYLAGEVQSCCRFARFGMSRSQGASAVSTTSSTGCATANTGQRACRWNQFRSSMAVIR